MIWELFTKNNLDNTFHAKVKLMISFKVFKSRNLIYWGSNRLLNLIR